MLRRAALAPLALVALVALGCHAKGTTTPSAAQGPPGLRFAPATTPWVFAILEPLPPELVKQSLATSVASLRSTAQSGAAGSEAERAMAKAATTLADWLEQGSWDQLGLTPGGRAVAYGLPVWPVLRLEIQDEARVRAAVVRLFEQAGAAVPEATRAGRRYWRLDDGRMTLILAVASAELVMAYAPSAEIDAMLPNVLGLERPRHSLADDGALDDAAARHGLSRQFVVTLNVPALLDTPELARALGALPPACPAELRRLTALTPRLVFGYRRFDTTGFHAALIVESPILGGALSALGTSVPGVHVPTAPGALASFGVAFDLEKVLKLLELTADALAQRRFECPALADLNDLPLQLHRARGGVPAELLGFKGFAVTVDELDLASSRVRGSVLLVMSDAITMVRRLGQLGFPVTVNDDGVPVELPLGAMGLGAFGPAFIAVRGERIAVTVGPDALTRAATVLAAEAAGDGTLAAVGFAPQQLRAALAALGGAAEAPSLLGPDSGFSEVGMGLGATSAGVSLEIAGTMAPAPGAPPPPAP